MKNVEKCFCSSCGFCRSSPGAILSLTEIVLSNSLMDLLQDIVQHQLGEVFVKMFKKVRKSQRRGQNKISVAEKLLQSRGKLGTRKRSFIRGVQAWRSLPIAVVIAPHHRSFGRVWTTVSDIGFDFCVILCRAGS